MLIRAISLRRTISSIQLHNSICDRVDNRFLKYQSSWKRLVTIAIVQNVCRLSNSPELMLPLFSYLEEHSLLKSPVIPMCGQEEDSFLLPFLSHRRLTCVTRRQKPRT